MCNACGFYCCASDMFDGCGCDGCPCKECWSDDEDILENAPACPAGGYTGQPSTELATVENCVKAGVCGCDVGAAMADDHT